MLEQYRSIEASEGGVRGKLKELYEHGYKLHWTVPPSASDVGSGEAVDPADALAKALNQMEVKAQAEAQEEDEECSMQDYM